MIQTPRSPESRSSLTFYAFLFVLWIVPGLLFAAGAVLAGGTPHTHIVEWPFVAIRSLTVARGRPLPWQWVGAPAVRSATEFWVAIGAIGVPLFIGVVVGLVTLRGGIPAVFPFLGSPPVRWRWAGPGTLARAGLSVGSADRRRADVRGGAFTNGPPPGARRLVLGQHQASWIAAREGVSLVAIGAAGSGKSASLCVPAIEEWEGPVVAVSDRPDLIELAAGVRQHRGRVDVLDPLSRTGMATCTWSPVEPRLTFEEAERMVEPMLEAAGADVDESVARVVTVALYCAGNLGVGVTTAVEWLDDLSGDSLVGALIQVDGRDTRATSWITRIVERSRDERAAYFSKSRELLRRHFEQAAQGFSPPAFRPADFLARDASTLFVVTPTDRALATGAIGPLVRALLAEVQHRRPRRPLLLVLDGAGSASVERLGDRLAARDLSVVLLATFRGAADLQGHLGTDAYATVGRARAVLFLGGTTDLDTLQLMHDLIRRQVLQRTRRRGVPDLSQPDLLPPDAARQLGPGRAVLLHERTPPALVWLRNSYDDPDLLERHLEQPFVRGVARISETRVAR